MYILISLKSLQKYLRNEIPKRTKLPLLHWRNGLSAQYIRRDT